MAEAGGFKGVPNAPVHRVTYIKVGRSPNVVDITMGEGFDSGTIQGELAKLAMHFQGDTVGYISRRAMEKMRYEGDFDHLARFGEWDATQTTSLAPVK